MIEKEKIERIVEDYLGESPLFLVEVKVASGNHVNVILDGDDGVPISACAEISRHIESVLDRDLEDFNLEVSSVGLSRPLSSRRQFKKNVGRTIAFYNLESRKKVEGKLLDVDEKGITVEKEVSKKKKKKDDTPEAVQVYPFDQINEVKVQPSFK